MPRPSPIADAHTLPALFTYDPATGRLHPRSDNPLALTSVRTLNRSQFIIGKHSFSAHRLIWAMHNPDPATANLRYVMFKDGDPNNTRIENLQGTNTHPRWQDHQPKMQMRQLPDGAIVPAKGYREALAAYYARGATPPSAPKPRPERPDPPELQEINNIDWES